MQFPFFVMDNFNRCFGNTRGVRNCAQLYSCGSQTTVPDLRGFLLAAAMTPLSSLCHLPRQSAGVLLCYRQKQRQREEEFVKIKVQIRGE